MNNQKTDEAPIFAAQLTAHRSLGSTGFWILMGFVFATCFISGILFLVVGAWPVFFFFGLDALLLWGAFKLNYRSGKKYEEISVWRHELEFRKIAPSGKTQIIKLNPFWTRFKIDRHDEIGITKMVLQERDRLFDIGAFLNPKDRESFALAFGSALAKAKSG